MDEKPRKAVAWILMGFGLVITFVEWRRGLVAIGVPDWLSWVISVPGSALIGHLWLGLAGGMQTIAKEARESGTLWSGLVGMGVCLLLMVAVGAFYIWVCEKGGGVNVTFP